ncbi:MAG: flap endonuclease-1 [Candidatus Woesearchaeota archaeon]
MGIAIKELVAGKEIPLKSLSQKVICMDMSLLLYQFLTTIRQSDGSYFTDSKGNVTSHLIGLSSRLPRLIQQGIQLVCIFDGKSPELKRKEQEKRHKVKEEAQQKYESAEARHDIVEMKKYAGRTAKLTSEIIEETKQFVSACGLPIIEAPSEAEVQASHMVKKGDAYAVATQDADALMVGSPRVIRNLSLLGKRKVTSKLDYQTYEPELVELSDVLNGLGIDHEQFILLCILIGTDFNPGGVKGIGPKNALKLVKEHKTKDALITALKDSLEFDFDEVYTTIKTIPVSDEYTLRWNPVDFDALEKILITNHNFSEERVMKMIEQLRTYSESRKQTNLSSFW